MKYSDTSVAIFWDYENCPVPKNASGYAIASRISTLARPFGSVKFFKAYLDISEQPPMFRSHNPVRSELQSCGVSLVDCPHNGRKEAADKMLLVDMLVYAIDNPAPSTVILITGDRDFAYALSILKLRQYHTVLVTLPDAHPSLTNQAKTCFDWVDSVVNSQAENARWTGRVLHNMPAYHLPLAHPSPCTLNPEDSSGPDTDTEECVDFAYHSMQMRRQLPLPPSPSVVRTKSGVDREGAISGIPTNKVVHSPPSEGASTAAVDSCSAYQDFGRTGSNLELNGEKTSEDSSCSGFSSDRPTTDLCFTKYEDKKRETLNKAQGPAFREILSSSSAVPPMEAEQVDADVPLPSAAGMQHISSSSSNTPPAGSHATSAPSPLPPIFVDLVRVLQRHRSKGIRRSFRSVVAKKIGTSLLLKEAGINSFHEFMTRAEEGSQYQEMT